MPLTSADKAEVPVQKKDSKDIKAASEQDLRNRVDVIISSLNEKDYQLHRSSLKSLINLIKNTSTTLISMPMLLQILIPHILTLKAYYKKCEEDDIKQTTADILSLLTTVDKTPETLHWKLLGSKSFDIGFWGSDYVTHLVKDIQAKFKNEKKMDAESLEIAKKVVKYELSHHATTQCVDFLIEIANVSLIVDSIEYEDNAVTVGHYLRRNAAHADPPEADLYLRTAFEVYFKFDKKIAALLTALQIKHNNEVLLEKLLKSITLKTTQMQICFILGRMNRFITEIADKDLRKIMGNTFRHQLFIDFAKREKLMDTKDPKQMLRNKKSGRSRGILESNEGENSNFSELALLNAFANCGFSSGYELVNQTVNNTTNSDRLVVIASLGFICLWDTNKATEFYEKYNSIQDSYRKSGAILSLCTASTGISSEPTPFALVARYLKDPSDDVKVSTIAGLGIAYIGSNRKELIDALKATLSDNLQTPSTKGIVFGVTGLSLGLVALASSNNEIVTVLINTIKELDSRAEKFETKCTAWFLCLGIALCCFGKEEQSTSTINQLKKVQNKQIREFAELMVTACAYFGTGDVLKVQQFLHVTADDLVREKKLSPKKVKKKSKSKSNVSRNGSPINVSVKLNGVQSKATGVGRKTSPRQTNSPSPQPSQSHSNLLMNLISAITRAEQARSQIESKGWKNMGEISNNSLKQAAATIGVVAIGIGEKAGIQMMRRMVAHQLRFCEQPVQRMAPLALALAYLSNPDAAVVQLLTKYALNTAADVSFNSILALGFVAAGTNNDKISKFLKTIFTDPMSRRRMFHNEVAMAAKMAFALVHLGKGALSLSPFMFDKQLIRETSIAAMLVLIVCCMDPMTTLFGNARFLWNFLAPCIQSKALITVDNGLKVQPTLVRVGKRVDITGKSGKHRAICGFNTLKAPVTLTDEEKAEPGPQEYEYASPILEDIVIVTKK